MYGHPDFDINYWTLFRPWLKALAALIALPALLYLFCRVGAWITKGRGWLGEFCEGVLVLARLVRNLCRIFVRWYWPGH